MAKIVGRGYVVNFLYKYLKGYEDVSKKYIIRYLAW